MRPAGSSREEEIIKTNEPPGGCGQSCARQALVSGQHGQVEEHLRPWEGTLGAPSSRGCPGALAPHPYQPR